MLLLLVICWFAWIRVSDNLKALAEQFQRIHFDFLGKSFLRFKRSVYFGCKSSENFAIQLESLLELGSVFVVYLQTDILTLLSKPIPFRRFTGKRVKRMEGLAISKYFSLGVHEMKALKGVVYFDSLVKGFEILTQIIIKCFVF